MTRVLILEDELSSQELARRALNRMGISDIICATDGVSGLKILDRMDPKPDLILCDVFMPEKDGVEIVHALGERKFGGGVILITGGDDQLLQIATMIATRFGLNVLGATRKPLSDEVLAQFLALLGK